MNAFNRIHHHAMVAVALAVAAASAPAAVVINNNNYVGGPPNTFNPPGPSSTPGLINQPGASYGEHFAGQTLTQTLGFPGVVYDVLSGTPTANLSLLANTLQNNIGVIGGGSHIHGDVSGRIGQGALSILLNFDSRGIGFDLFGAPFGTFTAQFFARDGKPLGSITNGIQNDKYYGFESDTCIAGVSLTNVGSLGIFYDNVTFDESPCQSVPEPGSLSLAGLALCVGGAIGMRRRLRVP